jgi:hypothetical protein
VNPWAWLFQHAEKIGIVTFLSLTIFAFYRRIVRWGFDYDKLEQELARQTKRTEYFMELARQYAALSRTTVEVAELLPSDRPLQEESTDGRHDETADSAGGENGDRRVGPPRE